MDLQWFPQNRSTTWFQRLCGKILQSGPIPKHVAFIMDGNRRFASKKSIERSEGHMKGVEKLAEVRVSFLFKYKNLICSISSVIIQIRKTFHQIF